jgi:hypothetical protein
MSSLDPLNDLRKLRDRLRDTLSPDHSQNLSSFERGERQRLLDQLEATILDLESRRKRRNNNSSG